MFKVICIDAGNRPECFPVSGYIQEGVIYTVIRCYTRSKNVYGVVTKIPAYGIGEVKVNGIAFAIDRFIPLSDINELQLVNEKELINQ